jgi:hypothetical protein
MKNYKVIPIVISIILILTAILMGCDTEVQASTYSDADRLQTARRLSGDWWSASVRGQLIVDTQTDVEYWYIENAGDSGGCSLTLLVDQDGKPLIWKGE